MLCVMLGLTFAAPRHTAHVTHQTNERRAVDARIAFGRSLLATARPADHCVVLLKLCHALKISGEGSCSASTTLADVSSRCDSRSHARLGTKRRTACGSTTT